MRYYDGCDENHLELSGIENPVNNCGLYYRLNAAHCAEYSDANAFLANCLSGVRLRFVTNAPEFQLAAQMHCCHNMLHFSAKGAYGFDVYTGNAGKRNYIGKLGRHITSDKSIDETVTLNSAGMTEVTVLLPLYGGVKNIKIGIPDGYDIKLPLPHSINNPICFYGSSITQGGCVSRPGLSYSNMLTLDLDAPCRNLGFSGSALGEQYAAEYIASINISAFVMDYDFNSPDAEHLAKTHLPFYRTVRESHRDIPVVFMTHPYYTAPTEDDIKRKNVVKATYEQSVADGENVYYIDSEDFFPLENRHLFAVDNCHPNDLGHYFMAQALKKVFAKINIK